MKRMNNGFPLLTKGISDLHHIQAFGLTQKGAGFPTLHRIFVGPGLKFQPTYFLTCLKTSFLMLAVLLFSSTCALAQEQVKPRTSMIGKLLSSKSQNANYDTSFITRPNSELTLKVRTNLSGNGIHARGTVNDIYSTADLHTRTKLTMSFAAIYKGVGVGLAVNPAKILKRNMDYELNVNIYGRRLSIDASYQRSKTLSGDIERGDHEFHLERGYVKMRVLNIAAYYAFNHRRFSYPAAFTQSYIQRQSAGSWLAGMSYQGGSIIPTDEAPETMPDLRIKTTHLGIGGGYGYNLVLGDKWLLHLSALPTVVVLNHNNLTINGERKSAQPMRLNLILNERLAIVRNFSSRYFASFTAVMNNSLFDDDLVIINQNKWRVRLALGVRF
ncbi:MAG: DUF4421 domain-containing protein [Prevotella sp.]|nr:DUF4421 domain-containing protein [Prevotella sp.]